MHTDVDIYLSKADTTLKKKETAVIVILYFLASKI